jgi:peptide/nickel transport system permease protein
MRHRGLLRLFVRRLVALAVILLVLSFGVFTLLYVAPGDTERLLLGAHPATPEAITAVRARYHLDQPFLVQYGIWLKGAVTLDFGRSVRSSVPVSSEIGTRIGVTALLGLYASLIAVCIGVPLGMLAAFRHRKVTDRLVVGASVVGVSAPAFISGIFLLYVFAVSFDWFPVSGQGSGFADRLWHFTLPAAALALSAMALIVKLTRAGMIRALEQDYVAFARARGLSWSRVATRYALRNALVPVITAGGLIVGYTLTGAVLIESTFSLPGLGSLLIDAVNFKDVPVVQAVALTFATIIVIVNLATDLLYRAVDPRIRLGEASDE